MIAVLNWFLGDVALPASATAALFMAFDWVCEHEAQWTLLISSTFFIRHIHAYEEARSPTPGGSDVAPGTAPQASAATRVGVEPAGDTVQAPPAPQALVGAAITPPLAAPTGTNSVLSPNSLGGRRSESSPTSPALAGLDMPSSGLPFWPFRDGDR